MLVKVWEAFYFRENHLKVADNINVSDRNALTILYLYKCKYRYTAVTSILYMAVSI